MGRRSAARVEEGGGGLLRDVRFAVFAQHDASREFLRRCIAGHSILALLALIPGSYLVRLPHLLREEFLHFPSRMMLSFAASFETI